MSRVAPMSTSAHDTISITNLQKYGGADDEDVGSSGT